MGRPWFENGKLLKKRKKEKRIKKNYIFNDFFASAEYIIENKKCSSKKKKKKIIGRVNGRSARGLLIGAVFNMMLEYLFKAAVPVLDGVAFRFFLVQCRHVCFSHGRM
jgi:protease II